MDIAAKIEKNRIALLRIIGFWLFAARLLFKKRCRTLPRRINAFVCDLIFTIEKATTLLVLIHAKQSCGMSMADKAMIDRLMQTENDLANLTIGEIITRLEAVQQRLRKLTRAQPQKHIFQWFQMPRMTQSRKREARDAFTRACHPIFQPP